MHNIRKFVDRGLEKLKPVSAPLFRPQHFPLISASLSNAQFSPEQFKDKKDSLFAQYKSCIEQIKTFLFSTVGMYSTKDKEMLSTHLVLSLKNSSKTVEGKYDKKHFPVFIRKL